MIIKLHMHISYVKYLYINELYFFSQSCRQNYIQTRKMNVRVFFGIKGSPNFCVLPHKSSTGAGCKATMSGTIVRLSGTEGTDGVEETPGHRVASML